MNNFLDKYSLNQNKIESIYNKLIQILKLKKQQVNEFIRQSDEGNLIRVLTEHKMSNSQLKEVLLLRSYELDSNKSTNNSVNREFQEMSHASGRNYFIPLGNYQTDQNGLLSASNGAICSVSCKGTATGRFLSFISSDSLLSYSYTPGDGLSYKISSVDKGSIVSYFSDVVNIEVLQGIESSDVRIDAIDVNYDNLDDIIISVTAAGFDNFPVVLLNDKISPFNTGYQLSDCSSSNGAIQIRTGYFFGTHQTGGLWCQNTNNNIGLFYRIDIKSSDNLSLKTAQSSWCANAIMVVLDYNGDKYDDAFCIGASQQQLFVSSNGLEMQSATADGTGNVSIFNIGDINSSQFVSGDFDGNGKADLLRQDNNGNSYLYLSNGKTFFDYKKGKVNNNNAIETGDSNFCSLPSKLLSGKFNNDQKSDLWCSTSNSDKFMLSTLESDRTYSKFKLLITYKDYYLHLPDLSSYSVIFATSKNFVNALDQGPVGYSVPLELNIDTTCSLDSYKKDVTLTNSVVSGKVNYVPQHNEYNKMVSINNLQGYTLNVNRNQQLEFDIMTSPEKVSANILSPWDRINLHDNVNFSVYPNKCVTAQLRSFVYKDVSSFYTAQGLVTILDERGTPLSGQRLLETAQSVINKPLSLIENGQAVFNTTGNILFSMPYKVESAVLPCSTLSSLQSQTALPKVIAKVTYDDFSFTVPNLTGVDTKTIISQEKLQNNKQYGQTSVSKTISLEVQLSQKIDGFNLDIKNTNLVKDGEVIYMKGFGDIQLTISEDLSGYRIDIANKDYLKHSWMTPASQISAELFSDWNTFKISSNVETVLVPGQCSIAKIQATLYHNVPFAYTAKGHFSASDESGYPITGDVLLAVAQNVLNKDVSIDSLGEAVFTTTATLTRNLVGNIITDIEDC